MKNYLIAFLILATSSLPVLAKQIAKEQLPAKISAHFLKKHPNAVDWIVTEQKHFGQALYEISFKENKEDNAVFYRTNGHFYVNAEKIYSFNIIPGVVTNGLKAAFPDYKITAAQLVINPNAAGEEYEITITSLGVSWDVSLDGKGNIISKEKSVQLPEAVAPTTPAVKDAVPAKK